MRKSSHIIVVGGGTAGLISALMLKTKFPFKKIEVIRSSKIGTIGVGESSTEHWNDFCRFVRIPRLETVQRAKSTWKIGVRFNGWSDNDFLHHIVGPHENKIADYYHVYAYLISENKDPKKLQPDISWENKFHLGSIVHNDDPPCYQSHFDTYELIKFLETYCKNRDINLIEDELTHVKYYDDGDIESVCSKDNEYHGEFFIDCSGFKRFLSKDIPWKSYSEYLPTNSAITFSTDEMEEYNKWTVATARKSGWSWEIPTQDRTGNGYVFCDEFINEDEALQEMEEALGHKIDDVKSFKFDPGRLETAWNKNCYSVGLSQGFIEPLEATSIGSIIQQMFAFLMYLPSDDYKTCNKRVNDIFDNASDFVQAHYLTKKEDTPFWQSVKYDIKRSSTLKSYLKMWKNRLPQAEDFHCPWGLFRPINYIPVLYGLGWFNTKAIKKEFDQWGLDMVGHVGYELNNIPPCRTSMSHKQMINIVKDSLDDK